MSTTILFPFTPSATSTFSFQPTFDGQPYTVIVNWNLYRQDYYINIYTLQGALVVCMPLIGSPNTYDISMTAGYFTTTLVYREDNQVFEVTS